MEREESVAGVVGGVELDAAEVRWRPAWTRRRDDGGADVRRERSWMSVGMVVSDGIWSGMVSPEGSLTKIWRVGEADEMVDEVEAEEDERDRMIAKIRRCWKCMTVREILKVQVTMRLC